ncbi:MAG: Flp pilus assembly complex ATPase component TadA [Betaproteobacteria bacterium]|nr:Flp pilus assembly complex ATPase component TadA [Betaproteobacteria bacterium]
MTSTGVSHAQSARQADLALRLGFFRDLQAVTNKIHAARDIDEIIQELSGEVCGLFNADRLTIYQASEDGRSIISRVKTGLHAFRDLRLPVSSRSVAGFVAGTRKPINVHDVYDQAELKRIGAELKFLKDVDARTGYRTRQMLVVPIEDAPGGRLLGVIQVINNKVGGPFSAMVEEGVAEMAKTLAIAFGQRQRRRAGLKTRYDYLVIDAVITESELDAAMNSARRKGVHVEEELHGEFQVPVAAIGRALAKFYDVPYEPFRADRIKPVSLLHNLKRDFLEEADWLPLEETDEGIVILAKDPEQVRRSRIVKDIFPRGRLDFHATTAREFEQTLDLYFRQAMDESSVADLLTGLEDDVEEADISPEDISAAAENELVRLVNRMIVDAYQQGASDIHIEPGPGREKTLVRFRRDGSLLPYIEVPASFRNALITRIKIMCDLDISERRKPQDGKIRFRKFGPLDIELRVATLPSTGGLEDVVMRILASGKPIPLDNIGLLPHTRSRLDHAITKPHGIFFVCGPTGSGKTTTLHSILGHINTPETKIWTVEDPVEITQKGLRQVQVNRKAGIDFPTVMRAFLRADPDVIMVGEMRDRETMSIGLEASLTGHLVFATLHTNSAPESVVRLLDLGMDPFNFADALLGVLAQRLAKRLCPVCRKPYQPAPADMEKLLAEYCDELNKTDLFRVNTRGAYAAVFKEWTRLYADPQGLFTLYEAVGCPECSGTGYKGRVGLHELMLGSDEVKRLIQEKARVATLLVTAMNEGMRTLKMDGMEKVLAGLTDMKQVRAVCMR